MKVTIVRKATGNVVGRNVPVYTLELYLACLPMGVYGIEDSDGTETALVTVSNGKVRIKPVATVAPVHAA